MSARRIASVLVGLLFLTAGILKALDPASFAEDIRNYRLLPWHGAVLLALYLPWLEIVCGAALISRRAYRGALWLLTALTTIFLAAYGSTRLRGLDVECGCFGRGFHRGFGWVLAFEALILAALAWVLSAEYRGDA